MTSAVQSAAGTITLNSGAPASVASDITTGKTFLASLVTDYAAAVAALSPLTTQWATVKSTFVTDTPSWEADAKTWADNASSYQGNDTVCLVLQASLTSAVDAVTEALKDINVATTVGDSLVSGALLVAPAANTAIQSGMAALDIASEAPAISTLLDELATLRASNGVTGPRSSTTVGMNLTVVPTTPVAGTNLASDALTQLNALAAALTSGDSAGAQTALDALAGDIQAIAGAGTSSAAGSTPSGSVSTAAATGIGVGGLAVGGVVGGLIVHAVATGAIFAGESKKRRKGKRK